MSHLPTAAACAFLLVVSAGCAPPGDDPPGRVVYRVAGTDKVGVKKDLVYKKAGGSELRFDLYLPAGDAPEGGHPVVVLIHGGPVPPEVRPQAWPAFESYGRLLAASGVAAVAFDYRFPSEKSLADGAADVADLIAHLRGRAKDLGLAGGRIGLWAFSGGGPQLSLAIREAPAYVRCVVSFYAPLDAPPGQPRYSPLVQLRAGPKAIPPVFIARAGKDFPEINRSVDAFVAEARKQKHPVEVADYPDGVHGFDLVTDTDESRAVVAGAVAFVRRHLLTESGLVESGDGARLYYEVRGAGPAVVLIHDGLLHGECWDGQWDALSKEYKLVRYDRRGYGRSSAPAKPYSDVEDLDRLVRHLGLTQASLVGSSAGGNLAIQYALAHPAAVERLVLVGPVVSGLGFSDHFRARNRAAFRPLAERGDVKAAIANWAADPYLTAPGSDAARKRLRELLEANPHNLTHRDDLQTPPRQPALGRLGEIKTPTLVLVGEADIPDVHAHCGAIQAGVAGSKRVVVGKAGHLPYLERPDEFNRLVSEFLGGRKP